MGPVLSHRLTVLCASLVFLGGTSGTTSGQEFEIHPVIDDLPTCKGPLCQIHIERSTTLTGEHIVEAAQLKRDSHGRFLMWSQFNPHTVYVLDNKGDLLASTGRNGEGPGEFRWITALTITKNDTLQVFDGDLSRVVTFEPHDFDHVKTQRLSVSPGPAGALQLSDGRYVVNANGATRETFGLPLHLLSSEGVTVRSFGRLDRRILPAEQPFLRRVLAEYEGNILSISTYQYVVEVWNPESGTLITGFERRPKGFRPRRRGEEVSIEEDMPPASVVMDARVDGEGRLWALSWVPGEDWKQHVSWARDENHRALNIDTSQALDTVIDIIDLETQQLVATRHLDVVLRGWVDDEHVFSYIDDDGLNPRLEVWRLTLRTPKDLGGRQ